MKYLIAVKFVLMACFSTFISAQKFEPPTNKVIHQFLNLSPDEFMQKCEDRKVLDEVLNQHYLSIKIAYSIAHDLVKRANQLLRVDDNVWKELVTNQCLQNAGIKAVAKDGVAEINECLDEKSQLEGKERTVFTNALFEAYCAAVKKLAKEKYAEGKN